ncbi:MAG: hypothetical protein ACE5JZ_00140 [Kiloniellales bacterium]
MSRITRAATGNERRLLYAAQLLYRGPINRAVNTMALDEYRTALVTGASRGMGAVTVRALTERGFSVHAVARRHYRTAADRAGPGGENNVPVSSR